MRFVKTIDDAAPRAGRLCRGSGGAAVLLTLAALGGCASEPETANQPARVAPSPAGPSAAGNLPEDSYRRRLAEYAAGNAVAAAAPSHAQPPAPAQPPTPATGYSVAGNEGAAAAFGGAGVGASKGSGTAVAEGAAAAENRPPARPQVIGLGTRPGFEIGVQVSDYRYQEHLVANTVFDQQTGTKVGLTGSGTMTFRSRAFVTLDLRAAYSRNDYSSPGSGTETGINELLTDIRLLGGRDFLSDDAFGLGWNLGIAPYVGLGYRFLYNDLRGITSALALGYQRFSHYVYLPIGVTPRFRVTDNSRIGVTMEYDQFIAGWEDSNLTDVNPAAPMVKNEQNSGYGMRGSAMFETSRWSVGPFFDYWNINQSQPALFVVGGVLLEGTEPHNQTIEYGMQSRYHF